MKPSFQELLPGKAVSGRAWFRMVNSSFAATVDDIGPSFLHGGRYNVRLEFGVLYLSTSPDCAFREKLRQVKGRKENLLAQTVASFQAKIVKCLDLTDDATLEALKAGREGLIREGDFSLPQSVARDAREAGFEALIAPSAAGTDCKTLVVFKDKLAPPSYCVLEAESVKPYPMR